MALRAAVSSLARRGFAATPLVSEKTVTFSAVLPDGSRETCIGLVGKTVAEALASVPALQSAVPKLSPRHGYECHVTVPTEWLEKLGELDSDQVDELAELAGRDTVSANSRLGSQITLTPELRDLVVAIAPLHPFKTL